MIKLEDFIPRNQQDRMALANIEMLNDINENIKKLIEVLIPAKQEVVEIPIKNTRKKKVE